MKYFFLLFAIFLCWFTSLAQQDKTGGERGPTIDSLRSLLYTNCLHDTSRINTLNALAKKLKNNNPDTAIILITQALNIAEYLPPSIGKDVRMRFISKSYSNLGTLHLFKGNNSLALDYCFKALKIMESLNDKKGISVILGNIGVAYDHKDDHTKALDYYFKALKMAEELEDKKGISAILGNIGLIYKAQGDYPKALDYYFKALKIAEGLRNKNTIALNLSNIGDIYSNQGDYTKALDYYFKALKMAEELGNKYAIAVTIGSIGACYNDQANAAKFPQDIAGADSLYKKALDHYFKALKMAEELGDKNEITRHLGNIGLLYTETKRYKQAKEYLQRALTRCDSIGLLDFTMRLENSMAELYTQTHQPDKALEHYKKYIAAKDSLFNEENTKKIVRSEMNFEFETKQAKEKAEQDKKDAIAVEELKHQRLQRNYFIIGFGLVLLLALFIFRSYRQKQTANVIITQQKAEVEKQKELVDEKNHEIGQSIAYAKHIQDSVLPLFKIQDLWTDSFSLYKPRDVVSGDFYWLEKLDNKLFFVAVDCTGHGIPGAFMSLIGTVLLNEIFHKHQWNNPSGILSHLNRLVKLSLKQQLTDSQSRDGMDIAYCIFDKVTMKLQYAGANRPLWFVRKGQTELIEIKATKKAIGGLTPDDAHFETHEIQLQQGDTFYIFTDGYADQFGGENRKKLMTKKFKEILLSIQQKTLQEQQQYLNDFIENWKAGLEQVDDICVIGVRV